MATIREYFESDPQSFLTLHTEWEIKTDSGAEPPSIVAKVAWNFEANAKFWYFLIPQSPNIGNCIDLILQSPNTARCVLNDEGDGTRAEALQFGLHSERRSVDLEFTKGLNLYIDADIDQNFRAHVVELGARLGFSVVIRDREYARSRSELEKPLVFISHDSRDKDTLVRELAHEMTIQRCPVWYDEFSLNVGDSLRQCIENGLKEAEKCIVVLSPNFFANNGWSKAEFDSIYIREISKKKNVILPVWHDVSAEQVYEYSPRLLDRVALQSSLGVKELARRLVNAVRAGSK